jgi:diguanylate cyclase (GGDEF)-like protein
MQDNPIIEGLRSDPSLESTGEPHRFFRSITYLSAVSAAIILVFTGIGMWRVVSYYVIRFAESSAVNISAALSASERDSFFTTKPESRKKMFQEIPLERLDWLDGHMRDLLKPFKILKIKVYTKDARIIYSTDRAIIGERDVENRRLRDALKGKSDSELLRRDQVSDLENEQRLDVDVVETYVPIYDKGEVIGCFEVYMDVSRYRDEIHQIVAIAIAVIGLIVLIVYGIALYFLRKSTFKLKEAHDMLQMYASSDPLTGLYNRRHLFVRAGQELSRLQREKGHDVGRVGMSVTLLDLDHFKKVNDTHGHLAGDEVLRETARRILATTRAYDLVGRLGGEEFIVVHPDADYVQAQGIANRIWGAIRAEPFIVEGKKIRVTASLGVATLDPAAEKDFTATLERADRALYGAKNAGRDRVTALHS